MSRFVRPSKYRHVYGQSSKKEWAIENIKVTNSAWDSNVIACSGKYLSLNWAASGGGAFAILPLPSPFTPLPHSLPYKLPDLIPLARGHTAPVLDTDWSPHDDSLVLSGGEDGKALLWKVEDRAFEGWGLEGWVPRDFEPVARLDASPRKVGQVLFHPTAQHVVATAAGDYNIKLWDLGNSDDPQIVLTGHSDTIQSITFNPVGSLIATTCRDRKLRLFDPRASKEAVRITDGHGGIKGARIVWMGERNNIATTGFSKMSDRQVSVWETGGLANLKTITIDQSAGIIMPFYSDNDILFLAGKGDGNIRYYEWDSDSLHALAEHGSSNPQRGMCFLPRRALSVSNCEIARAYKVGQTSIEPVAFVVPRKADTFQSDIFPPAPSSEPSLSAGEYFMGQPLSLKLMSLADGAISQAAAASTPSYSTPAPTKTASAPAPAPASSPAPAPIPSPAPAPTAPAAVSTSPVSKRADSMDVDSSFPALFPTGIPTPAPAPTKVTSPTAITPSASKDSGLEEENAQLREELREANAKIRNLELQVETIRANAHRAAKALLDGN